MKKFEQHLQTGVATTVLAVLLWGGVTLNALQVDVAVLKADMRHVKEAVAHAKKPSLVSGQAAVQVASGSE